MVSAIFGRVSSSWMIGCCVTSSSAANELVDGQLRIQLSDERLSVFQLASACAICCTVVTFQVNRFKLY